MGMMSVYARDDDIGNTFINLNALLMTQQPTLTLTLGIFCAYIYVFTANSHDAPVDS